MKGVFLISSIGSKYTVFGSAIAGAVKTSITASASPIPNVEFLFMFTYLLHLLFSAEPNLYQPQRSGVIFPVFVYPLFHRFRSPLLFANRADVQHAIFRSHQLYYDHIS